MSDIDKKDLTRWNRAGLSQFRYIQGNAVSFLETLRQKLVVEYDDAGTPTWEELVTLYPVLTGETALQKSRRLTDQYYGERRDYAWEILRTYARSLHVLGEYVDAYANEGYLPTAVEWDNVRKLVALLGYRPSPPASAETHIALLFKKGESGTVDKGFAVKNKPASGDPTILFETQEQLEGSEALNLLHLRDYDKSGKALLFEGKKVKGKAIKGIKRIRFPLAEAVEDVSVGDLGVLASPAKGLPVEVKALSAAWIDLEPLASGKAGDKLSYHNTRLYLKPGVVAAPLPHGEFSGRSKAATALAEGELVFGMQDKKWQVLEVGRNELDHLQFRTEQEKPRSGETLYRARVVKGQQHEGFLGNDRFFQLPGDVDGTTMVFYSRRRDKLFEKKPTERKIKDEDGTVKEIVYYFKDDEGNSYGKEILIPDTASESALAETAITELRFAGKKSGLESGCWAMIEQKDGDIAAVRIDAVRQQEKWFAVELSPPVSGADLMRAGFEMELAPAGYDINTGNAWSSASTTTMTLLELDGKVALDDFRIGRKLLCATDRRALLLELRDITQAAGVVRLHVTPAFHLDPTLRSGFNRWATKIYGNTVRATHGETQPEKILGNGDASRSSQRFKLPRERISWVADPQFSAGVRADLTLRVGQRIWQQVEDFTLSSAEDHHYMAQLDEEGVLEVIFGDGRNGRRLPTGIDNVRVRYRTGYGEEGNLAPNALVKIARPHALVEDFVAPLETSGGAEKETSASMRENAPATVLALERAVSIEDFSRLAAHHSMVWQAYAWEVMPNRPARPEVRVVIVPAGGEPFGATSDTASTIRSYLVNHAVPNTPVSVVSFEPVYMNLKLDIMVDETAYDKKAVEQAVAEHLGTELSNRERKLGQALYRSEVIALMEQVEGVENGICELLDANYGALPPESRPVVYAGVDGKTRRIGIKPWQLLYLDTDRYPLSIEVRSYEI